MDGKLKEELKNLIDKNDGYFLDNAWIVILLIIILARKNKGDDNSVQQL